MLHNPLRHFTHFLSDASPVFSKAGPLKYIFQSCSLIYPSCSPDGSHLYSQNIMPPIPIYEQSIQTQDQRVLDRRSEIRG